MHTRAPDHSYRFLARSVGARVTARLLDQLRWARSQKKPRDPIALSSIKPSNYVSRFLLREKSGPSRPVSNPVRD
jgi:hypothetical protein